MAYERKGRVWKRVVPEREYRQIEGILFKYADMKRDVKEWRESVILGSRHPDNGMPRGHAHISDPTALATIKMIEPPPRIASCIMWIEVIDAMLQKLQEIDLEQETFLYDICRSYYHIESLNSRYGTINNFAAVQKLADKHHTSRSSILRDKDLIVTHAYTIAVWKGILSPVDETPDAQ